jgi:hypothetical protein
MRRHARLRWTACSRSHLRQGVRNEKTLATRRRSHDPHSITPISLTIVDDPTFAGFTAQAALDVSAGDRQRPKLMIRSSDRTSNEYYRPC